MVCFKNGYFMLSFIPDIKICKGEARMNQTGKGEGIMVNQTEIGKFISGCRKEKKLTQAELAEKLNITDRAVSKWETGKSMPDSSIMLELCEILGITVNELLSGQKVSVESYERKADENLVALKRRAENNKNRTVIISILFSAALFIGVMVCFICDIAISGHFTWSLIPASSIAFAWVIAFPGLIAGRRGIAVSLLSCSVFVIPYLYLLSRLLGVKEVISIGAAVSVPSIAFLWVIFAVCFFIGKKDKWTASGVSLLCAVPFVFVINLILSRMIEEPVADVWDLLTVFVLLVLAVVSFLRARAGRK